MGSVTTEGCGKEKKHQPILLGDVGEGPDFKGDFLEEFMSKQRAKAPIGGMGGGCREKVVVGKRKRTYTQNVEKSHVEASMRSS